jgi:phosphoribosylformimino-5-aminoimidazole carboxamide ribotide isomerase
MMVIPAIDLMDGHAVRLSEGDRERVTIYDDKPWKLAERFAEAGASRIHIVDLDGAFVGVPVQLDLMARLIDSAHQHGATVEVGGGIRGNEAAEAVLASGADLVVVGTMAVREPETVERLCSEHPNRIIVAIDSRDGRVAVDGWRQDSSIPARELAETAVSWGAAALLYTDVARDGLQVGPAVDATAALQRDLPIPVIASGGVGSLADLERLHAANVQAVVFGRALYEGSFTIEEALRAAC